jgi:MFS family permease
MDRTTTLRLVYVNMASFLSQTVQIGALPVLVSATLSAQGLDPFSIGCIAVAPWLAIIMASRFIPAFLARTGLFRGVIVSAVLCAASTLLLSTSASVITAFAFFFLFGLGFAVRWIACDIWIIRLAPRDSRGRAIGVHETMMGMGIAAGPLLIWLTGAEGARPFVISALLLIAAAAWAALARGSEGKADIEPATGAIRFFSLMPTGLIAATLSGFCETSVISLMVASYQAVGQGVKTTALLLTAFGLGSTALQIPVGWLSDRFGYHLTQWLCLGAILAGAALVALTSQQVLIAAMVMFFWGGAIGGMNTLAVIEAGIIAKDDELSGAVASVMSGYTVGSLLGPLVTGAIMMVIVPYGLMLSVALCTCLAAACSYGIHVRRAKKEGLSGIP